MVKDEKPNPLVQSRIAKLEEIGFNFTVHSDKWMEQYLMLKAYKEKHGDCQVPTHYAENPKLGRWTHTQRHQRRLKLKLYKKSSISQERIALLDDLGFNWEVRPSIEQPRATWHQRYDELVEYYTNNGNFLVSPETHPKLYRWCSEQRSRLKKLESHTPAAIATEELPVPDGEQSRRMGPDRVKLLSDIGFTSNVSLAKPTRCSMDPQYDKNVDCKAQQTTNESSSTNRTETLCCLDLESNDLSKSNSAILSQLNEQHDE
jgi:Helicase associated domain